jgi:PAS domain S-box-containing protein
MTATPAQDARPPDPDPTAPCPAAMALDHRELLEAVADGVIVLRHGGAGLVVEWASRRFLALAGLDAVPAGDPPDFLHCHAENRSLALHPPGASLPDEMRLAVRVGALPVCLVDVTCRALGAGRLVLTCRRVPDDELFDVFADLPLPTLVFDTAMRLRWLNAAAQQAIGVDLAALADRDWYGFLPEALDRRTLHEDLLASLGRVHTIQAVPMTFPGQATRWFRVHYRPFRDASGGVGGLIAIGEEVTQRHVAERALRIARESLRLAVEGANLGFFEYDVAADAFQASDEYYAMLGLDCAAERARPAGDQWARVHPEDLGALRTELAALLTEPTRRSEVELRLATGSGQWLWVLQRARVTEVGPDGRALRIAGMAIDIDRRKRAERGLAQSEARYRTLGAITPGLLHESEYDAEGRFVLRWASEGLTRLLGWTVEEFNARGGWSAMLHPTERSAAEARRARILAGEQTRAEVRLLTRSGGYVWMSSFSCPLQDPDTGRTAAMMGALYEVGHLKDTEAALRRSESRYRVVSELMSGVVFEAEIDADGQPHVSWLAGRADNDFGWTPEDFTVGRWRMRHHPDDVPLVEQRLARLLAGEATDGESRVLTKDGHVRWARFLTRPVHDPATGRVERIVGAIEDITPRKLAEQQLRESEFRYRTVTELAPGFVYEARFRGEDAWTLEWVGPGFERIYGCSLERVAELGLAHFYPADELVRVRERARRARNGEDVRAEVPIRDVDGRPRWIEVTIRPVRSEGSPVWDRIIGLVEDITARRHAEEQLRRSAEALRESEERFRLAAEAFNGIIYDYDARAGTTTRSRGIREVLGYEPEAVAPTVAAWQALVHPEDRARLGPVDVFAEPGRLAFDAHYRLRHAAGHWVEVWDRALAVRDASGAVVRVVGCSIDVTSERRFQRMLAEAEAVAHVGSWEYDVRTGRSLWSPGTYRIHELAPGTGELPDDPVREYCAPEFRAAVAAAGDRALRTGEPWELDVEIVTAHGRRRWVRVSGRAEREDGRTLRLYGAIVDIDALKRTQIQLQQQGDWLRMSIDASSLTAWRWYPDSDETIIEYRSDAMGPRHGSERPTLAGWLQRVDPTDRERVAEALRATARDGAPTHEEYLLRDAEGEHRWLVTRATRSRDEHGYVVTGTTQDVTARRDAEERLRASEAVLRSVAENSPDFVTIVGPDLRIRFANRAIDGVAAEQVVGRSSLEFALGGPDAMVGHLRRVLATGLPHRYEVSALRPDGLVHHYEQRLGAIRDGESIAGVIVHTTDVTDRREAERRLRAQASVLATMLEGVVLVDARGAIRLTNPAFDRMFGHEPGALDGRPFAALLGGDPVPSAGTRASSAFLGCRDDGTRFEGAAIASGLELGGEPYTVYVVQDVTERRTLERELLEIANREQRRIGSDLHDGLGQELTGVALMLRGLASRVKRGQPATPGDLDELVALVNGAIESTRSLARGLSPIELERGGLVYALRALTVRARELYGLDVKFRSRVWPELTLDAAATTHLYRIAQEALTNAARHARATQVSITLTARDRRVVLAIADDGDGIRADGGNGMGLKLMRYRAQMMGGELAISSGVPTGTRVACRVSQPERPGTAAGAAT